MLADFTQDLQAEIGPHIGVMYCAAAESSSTLLKQRISAGRLSGPALLFTTWQYGGRGTRGREWFQPPPVPLDALSDELLARVWVPRDIALSLALPREGAALADPRLSLCLGALAARVVELKLGEAAEAAGLPQLPRIQVKWPNDLMCRAAGESDDQLRKCAGILLEDIAPQGNPHWLIIGIGINVNSRIEDYPEELRGRLTTLAACMARTAELTGRSEPPTFDAPALIRALAVALVRELGLERTADEAAAVADSPRTPAPDVARLMREWLSRDRTRGARYTLTRGGQSFAVTADHVVGQTGELICFDERGAQYAVSSYTELSAL